MSNRTFAALLVAVLVIGGAIGGAFFGGLAIGEGRAEEASTIGPAASAQQPGGAGGPDLSQIRQQILEGEASPEELGELRQQFLGAFGGAGGGPGLGAGVGGLAGTIESIEGNTITVSTQRGTLVAEVGDETIVQMTSLVSLDELAAGMNVAIAGNRGEDGAVLADSVFVVPEGIGGGIFGGFPRGGALRTE